jgi:hypothetical protein
MEKSFGAILLLTAAISCVGSGHARGKIAITVREEGQSLTRVA